jgi:uncharacterized coiled-coil protein SlyX
LHDLLDGELSPRDARAMAEHEAHCPYCAALRTEMRGLLDRLANLDADVEPPEEFSITWRQLLRGERKPVRVRRHGLRAWIAIAAVLIVLFGGTSIMRSGWLPLGDGDPDSTLVNTQPPVTANAGSTDPAASPQDPEGSGSFTDDGSAIARSANLRILRSGSYTMLTGRFEEDMQAILTLSTQVGGWVAKESVSGEPLAEAPNAGRLGQLQLRIPDASLSRFLESLRTIGKIQTSELSAEDFSDQYAEYEARLEGFEAQLARLTERLEQTQDIAESLQIETAMTELRALIDTTRAKIQNWNAHEIFAQVDVTLTEYASVSGGGSSVLGARMRVQFVRSLKAVSDYFKDMLVFIVIAAPWVFVAALMAALALLVERLHWRSRQL